MAKSFQKNLVVWKRKSEIELLEDGKEVSEELSSVETWTDSIRFIRKPQVSEELSSVETLHLPPYIENLTRVSEELSSVETFLPMI